MLFVLPANQALSQVRFYTNISEGPFVAGQTFQIQYVAEGARQVSGLQLPELKGFSIHDSFESKSSYIPAPGQPLQQAWSKILVVSALQPGQYIVPGASALLDGKKMKSEPRIIHITALGAVSGNAVPKIPVPTEDFTQLREGEKPEEKIKGNHFIRAELSKTECYAGEGVQVTYKLYTRFSGRSSVVKRPSFTGFSVVEMVDSYSRDPEIELLNGKPYYVNVIRKAQLFPLQAGRIPLDEAEVESIIPFKKAGSGKGGSLNQLLDSSTAKGAASVEFKTVVVSEPAFIDVRELPSPKQGELFNGAMGRFTLTLETGKAELAPGELVKVRLIINGQGNIPLLVAPEIQWPKGADTADPVVKEEYNKYQFPLEGYKSFEYSFTAPDSGTVTIPPARMTYFDPKAKVYRTIFSEALRLTVNKALESQSFSLPADLAVQEETIPRQYYWFAGVAFLILGWVGFQLFRKKDPVTVVQSVVMAEATSGERPDPFAKSRLSITGEARDFYRSLQEEIWQWAAARYQLTPSECYKGKLQEVMQKNGVIVAAQTQLLELLATCEWALYTGDSGSQKEPAVLLAETEQLIAGLEK